MPYTHPHKTRRTQTTSVHVPAPKPQHGRKKLAMIAGVSLSMLVIVGLYAASFRYNTEFQDAANDAPRWTVLKQEFSDQLAPIQARLKAMGQIKDTMTAVVRAEAAQASAIELMKAKLQNATSTASTPLNR